jgi:polygalacturonase
MNFTGCNNIKLLGNGIIDLSHLDRGERRGLVIAYSSNIEIRGVKFINSPEWTFITYDSQNITIKDVDIFGYRLNSDAFAICNTRNATIDNSFCRSGDDLFDVKTLGGAETAISKNITFSNCTAWNGKARCFGFCGEANKEISDITFKDSCVVFHDATWDINRIPTIAIVVSPLCS